MLFVRYSLPTIQVISLIRPPGLPAEKADRRIWRMMTSAAVCLLCIILSKNLCSMKAATLQIQNNIRLRYQFI